MDAIDQDRPQQDKNLNQVNDNSRQMVLESEDWFLTSRKGRVHEFEGQLRSKVILCHRETTTEAILMKAVLGPGTAITDTTSILDGGETLL